MSLTHTFIVEEAVKHGLQKAIILQNIRFWLTKNKANKHNIHDGFVWTYNSSEAFKELFPYMSAPSIRRYLKDLEDSGVLKSGNYNKSSYDRTKWYTIIEEFAVVNVEDSIDQNEQWIGHTDQPIPDINTDNKHNNNIYIQPKIKKSDLVNYQPSEKIKQLATEKGWSDPESVLEEFKDYHMSRGTKLKDVEAALRTWLRNGLKYKQQGNKERRDGQQQSNYKRKEEWWESWNDLYVELENGWGEAGNEPADETQSDLPEVKLISKANV